MPNQVTLVITYDEDIRNPRDVAEIMAISDLNYEGVTRVTAICGDAVVTRNA